LQASLPACRQAAGKPGNRKRCKSDLAALIQEFERIYRPITTSRIAQAAASRPGHF